MKAKADFICDVCGAIVQDHPLGKKPPKHCRKIMRRLYHPTPVIWNTSGGTGAGKERRDES